MRFFTGKYLPVSSKKWISSHKSTAINGIFKFDSKDIVDPYGLYVEGTDTNFSLGVTSGLYRVLVYGRLETDDLTALADTIDNAYPYAYIEEYESDEITQVYYQWNWGNTQQLYLNDAQTPANDTEYKPSSRNFFFDRTFNIHAVTPSKIKLGIVVKRKKEYATTDSTLVHMRAGTCTIVELSSY